MYNLTMPSVFKAWLDQIMVFGRTWTSRHPRRLPVVSGGDFGGGWSGSHVRRTEGVGGAEKPPRAPPEPSLTTVHDYSAAVWHAELPVRGNTRAITTFRGDSASAGATGSDRAAEPRDAGERWDRISSCRRRGQSRLTMASAGRVIVRDPSMVRPARLEVCYGLVQPSVPRNVARRSNHRRPAAGEGASKSMCAAEDHDWSSHALNTDGIVRLYIGP